MKPRFEVRVLVDAFDEGDARDVILSNDHERFNIISAKRLFPVAEVSQKDLTEFEDNELWKNTKSI